MRHFVNPQDARVLNPFEGIIPPLGLRRIRDGWQGVFRHVLLHLMPAQQLGEHFHKELGRPTKELYSIVGLLFLQEIHNWTNAQSVEAYLFRTDVQYALNLEPGRDQMCERTFERYRALFLADELARGVMDTVTAELIQELELNIGAQRLDSTHLFSNMARFGRTRLIGVTIKRFLTQVQRHHPEDYRALPETLRVRYTPSNARLFAGDGTAPADRARTLQNAADDLHTLIARFADHAGLKDRPSYRALVTVFTQQCELVGAKVQVRTKTGGETLQNPSDPDATYDGHKGSGYQVQLSETCSDDNAVQLIVVALPQTAACSDADALPLVLDHLGRMDRLPETMLADTSYGGDGNVEYAAGKGVELVSPVGGMQPDAGAEGEPSANGTLPRAVPMEPLTIDDFAVDERTGRVTACPAGRIPLETIHDIKAGTTTVQMGAPDCRGCSFRPACPIQNKGRGRYELCYTDKQRRLAARRREEDTDVFRERYAKRSGIESTNSGLKRRLGLGRLRVRGEKAVFHATYLKVAGWNVFRAVASGQLGDQVAAAMAARVARWLALWVLLLRTLAWGRIRAPSGSRRRDQPIGYQHGSMSRLRAA